MDNLKTFSTTITHEGEPTTAVAHYHESSGQIVFHTIEDHNGNFLSVGMADQKLIRERIREQQRVVV